MHFSQLVFGLLTVAFTPSLAVPVFERAVTDVDILNYALTLEHLEDVFYREGLSKYSQEDFAKAGYDATFYANLREVSKDETTHVSFLTTALKAAGATPVQACTYKFPYNSPQTFLATASVLEGVGVSAYLGAAASIVDKTYLTAAGSILTVESRHSSYIRAGLRQSPFPQPFDAPLDLNEVYSLASAFIVSCPKSNPPLPVKAFPKLTLSGSETVMSGGRVTLKTPGQNLRGRVYAAFIAVTGPTFVEARRVEGGYRVEIPKGFAGQTYVVLTNSDKTVSDETTVAGPAIIEISS